VTRFAVCAQARQSTTTIRPDLGYFASNAYSIRRVSNPGGTPVISDSIAITDRVYTTPAFVIRHKGNDLETGTTSNGPPYQGRMFLAIVSPKTPVIRAGHLWTAELGGYDNTGTTGWPVPPGFSATPRGLQYSEIQGLDGTPSVVQTGALGLRVPRTT